MLDITHYHKIIVDGFVNKSIIDFVGLILTPRLGYWGWRVNMNIKLIINRKISSLYLQGVMRRKGWSEDYLRALLIDFITDTQNISLYDFMENQPCA